MKISDRIRLEHIHEALLEVEGYVMGVSEADFLKSSLIRNAEDVPELKTAMESILEGEVLE